jgi:transcriptional regulator with XRE-family HTH domain
MTDHRDSGKWKGHFAYIAESALWDFVETLDSYMKRSRISRTELAERAKIHPSQVTRILSGDHNMTVTTMAKLAAALGTELRLELGGRPVVIESKPWRLSQAKQGTKLEPNHGVHGNPLAVAA